MIFLKKSVIIEKLRLCGIPFRRCNILRRFISTNPVFSANDLN
jgi:hypothetical protein